MRTRVGILLAMLGLACAGNSIGAADGVTCAGKFPNPITDLCWGCILPITIGTATVANLGGQEDIENPSSPVCSCGVNPMFGVTIGFWEPARTVEVVRKPFCLVSLGGVDMSPGIPAPEAAQHARRKGSPAKSFYHAHLYLNPVLYWLQVISDFPCVEKGSLDLAYLTEVDPLWSDDELSLILNPDAVLFANPVAIAACAADCVAASVGFGIREMFWCAGCQGGLYPVNGHVPAHTGGVASSLLLTQRLMAKMHRELIAWGWHGTPGLCGPYYEPVMDKREYKTQLVYPIPETGSGGVSCHGNDTYNSGTSLCQAADGTTYNPSAIPGEGRCCQPFGRTTALWAAGKEFPVRGEDFAYMLWRKRNCCIGYNP
jgi:conjugal transfer pilus assembly protein TraU